MEAAREAVVTESNDIGPMHVESVFFGRVDEVDDPMDGTFNPVAVVSLGARLPIAEVTRNHGFRSKRMHCRCQRSHALPCPLAL